ncbi:MAG: Ppx/GppA family phosphatase, partial [Prevotella sp.]
QVDDYRACATSAMRDAENGKKVMRMMKEDTGINLEIIDGREEAMLLCNNIVENVGSLNGNYAYIDVGGGSTEISLLHDGQLVYSYSYNIGTLRMLGGKVSKETIEKMKSELKSVAADMPEIKMIGSGGNINKIYKLSRSKTQERTVSVSDIRDIYEKLRVLGVDERIEQFGLKADRADVIIPAAEIFLTIADVLGCNEVQVPNISLADSIIDGMYKDIGTK